MNYNKKHIIKVLALLIIFTGTFNAFSQTKVTTSKDSTSVVKPQFIPTLKIIDKIEVEKESIKGTYKDITKDEDIVALDSLLPVYTNFIKDQKKSTENFIKANSNRLKINILIKKWNGYTLFLIFYKNRGRKRIHKRYLQRHH